ncbi:HET-domain-containing protein [Zopfia rhizophila CBS 207.26]|uniref:HET-domain-containing protein n=1 Tax=Zopfia rhizophila CBS 207.26 TaxID=1314779 RepID=A0A6A6DNC9_9PEZI|nr:HET-domain-containing protein [Zopfia rhizophila CBS 207.26]
MLCTTCSEIFQSNVGVGTPSPHHKTLADLESAKNLGCYICKIVHEELLRRCSYDVDLTQLKTPAFTRNYCFDSGQSLYGIEISVSRYNYMVVSSTCRFFLWPLSRSGGFNNEETGPHYGRLRHDLYKSIPYSTGAPEVSRLALSWLHKCKKGHTCCHELDKGLFHPPRLLDVFVHPPRLVLSQKFDAFPEYAALSHCWGRSPTFITLTASHAESFMRDGIPDADMPANFRDAVQICRWLNIRYLWIDSLCIIQSGQGSDEDWFYHVKHMKSIYGSCQVCISASCAASATESCFRSRNLDDVAPFTISLRLPDSTESEPKPHILIPQDLHQRGHRHSPLAFRGWALQERILAPRVLTFGSKQVFWECSQAGIQNTCESFPEGISIDLYPKVPFSLQPLNTTLNGEELSRNWLDLIQTYSRCQLTRPNEDKFAAIEGLADWMAILSDSREYVAGFFPHELPQSLLWCIPRDWIPKERPKTSDVYRAPTWSWASADVEVEPFETYVRRYSWHYNPSQIPLATLTSNTIIGIDNARCGRIKYAELTLIARPIKLSWDASSGLNNPEFSAPGIGYKCRNWFFFFDSEDDFYGEQQEVFFLGIIEFQDWCFDGLVLKRVRSVGMDARKRPRYVRIGKGRIYDDGYLEKLRKLEEKEITLV